MLTSDRLFQKYSVTKEEALKTSGLMFLSALAVASASNNFLSESGALLIMEGVVSLTGGVLSVVMVTRFGLAKTLQEQRRGRKEGAEMEADKKKKKETPKLYEEF